MPYHKPEIEILGKAIFIINGLKEDIGVEGPYFGTIVIPTPSYELDE